MPLRFLALLCLLPAPLTAATLATTTLPDGGYDVVSYNSWKGQSFTLSDAASGGVVSSATLKLEIVVTNSSLTAFIVGTTAGSGVPDPEKIHSRLGLPATAFTGEARQVTFELDTSAPSKPVEAGATYWLLLGMVSQDFEESNPSGVVRWHYATTYGQDAGAAPGWTVGTRTAASGTAGLNWSASVETPYLFEMTAVPEPGVLSLLPVAGLLLFRRRK